MHSPQTQSMFLSQITEIELQKEIMSLNVNKSPGIDEISPKVVSASFEHIHQPLLHVFNLSFTTGVFPSLMKTSKTIPLFKKKSKLDPGNYRPISLLSIFSKILERLMHKRVYSYLTKFNVFFELQFGFRNNHSTTMALIEIIDNIRENLDHGTSVLGIFLDLSKAFDLVNHDKLLYKLSHYGIRGSTLGWFRSYLSERKQITFVNGVMSDPLPVNIGVPQGSVLGPLLFLIYVNDIGVVLEKNAIRLFADDTNIFITGRDLQDIKIKAQHSLDLLFKWFNDNCLLLNISKTCFTLFSHKIKATNIVLTVNDTIIPQVDQTKYLGVVLDKDLSFNAHCQHVKTKLTKLSSVFHYISSFIDYSDARTIYFAYALPYIQYGIELFGLSSKKNTNMLQLSQNKLLKLLCCKNKYDSATELHNELKIFKIEELTVYFLCNFVFKKLNGKLPSVFEEYFVRKSNTNLRSHRNLDKLTVPFFRTEKGRKSVKGLGARYWNQLPENTSQSQTLTSFKKQIKNDLLSNHVCFNH